MADLSMLGGGAEDDHSELKKLNAEVVSIPAYNSAPSYLSDHLSFFFPTSYSNYYSSSSSSRNLVS